MVGFNSHAESLNADAEQSHTVGRGLSRIGVSGWSYKEWRGKFYPHGLPARDQLGYLAQHFDTVELNSPFYRLQTPEMYQRWNNVTPNEFCFSLKGWRGITHFKKLRNAEEAIEQFFSSGISHLGTKLGPILWQLPPSLPFDAEVLDSFLSSLPRNTADIGWGQGHPLRYALEPRSLSFECEEAYAVLRAHNTALVEADSAGKHPRFSAATADFRYLRLHGSPRIYYSSYSQEVLGDLANRITDWDTRGIDSFVYFDNTALGHAITNALTLRRLIGTEAG